DCSNLGENTITLTATDASGNQASATAVVTVVDNSAPTLVTQDITVNLDENGTVSIQPGGVLSSVEDNCSSIEDISLSLDEDTFTAEGVYVVNLTSTDASGNSTTVSAEVTVEDTLGVNDIGLDLEVKLYPNPASDNIFFEISNADVQRISIYDINGRLIKTSNALSMNISELSSGVYFTKVEVKNGKAIKVLRFIKK
ncbi:T9SS type A sorting domain-containing protein, partial [Psychroflexus gondwanensis]|uniref:T9SS type A sorting domain-containing protein n=1 Tax=Psychroflexus gondwanensis TaxID=251 RepID=UPI0011BDC762